MMNDVRNYRVYVEPLAIPLGGGFVAYAPELKGCLSDGASPDEALHNIYEAIACWIADAEAKGEPVPIAQASRAYA